MIYYLIAALVILAVLTGSILAFAATTKARHQKRRYNPGIIFWSELQPGSSYHVEITSSDGRRMVFTDEFIGYSHGFSKAHFANRTVLRVISDQTRVELVGS